MAKNKDLDKKYDGGSVKTEVSQASKSNPKGTSPAKKAGGSKSGGRTQMW